MKISDALQGVSNLGVDTAPVIYFIEANPRYNGLVTDIFDLMGRGAITGVASTITLTEVLVRPYQLGDTRLQQEYRDLLLNSAHFRMLPVDSVAAERAAELRALYRLRTPDALQIAAALGAGCEAFLTNDLSLQRIAELRVLVLEDLEL